MKYEVGWFFRERTATVNPGVNLYDGRIAIFMTYAGAFVFCSTINKGVPPSSDLYAWDSRESVKVIIPAMSNGEKKNDGIQQNPKCLDCAFYHLTPIKTNGQCRRFPPQLLIRPSTAIDVISFEESSLWPRVDESFWCGEFKPSGL